MSFDSQSVPLVTVIVLTYNSQEYILETLESIRKQRYSRIQLIVSDDCSTDATVSLVKRWLHECNNGVNFEEGIIVENEVNYGISKNCNNGLAKARGEWIKYIAGDDLLASTCIESFVKQCVHLAEPSFLVSDVEIFYSNSSRSRRVWRSKLPNGNKAQLRRVLKGGAIKATSAFLSASILRDLGAFDENFPFLEDDPLWVKYLQSGRTFVEVKSVLVEYRVHDKSVSNASNSQFMNPVFFVSLQSFLLSIIIPAMRSQGMRIWAMLKYFEVSHMKRIIKGGNRASLLDRLIFKFLYIIRDIL